MEGIWERKKGFKDKVLKEFHNTRKVRKVLLHRWVQCKTEREGTRTKHWSKGWGEFEVFQRQRLSGMSIWEGNPGPLPVGVNSRLRA